MLPTVGADSVKIIDYAAEVAGRTLGIATLANLVPDPANRAALVTSGNLIKTSAQQLVGAFVARLTFVYFDQRVAFGKGRGIDRGFDAVISVASETIRTSLPDRSTKNPDYLEIFPDGAEEFTSPTIKEDEELALTLRKVVHDSKLTVKGEVLTLLDAIIPLVGPVALEIKNGEKHVNELFQTEYQGRKAVIDTLWAERKNIENILGRGGRKLARFVFFDFRKGGEAEAADEPPAPILPVSPIPPK